jgi:hypothetical protein
MEKIIRVRFFAGKIFTPKWEFKSDFQLALFLLGRYA